MLWEPRCDALTQAGNSVLLRECAPDGDVGHEPGSARQDRWDPCPLPGAPLAVWPGTVSSVPGQTVQALRTMTRTRRDLVAGQSAARQRLHDELEPVFPVTYRGVGAGLIVPAILPSTLLQRIVPSATCGCVFSVIGAVAMAANPLGLLLAPALGQRFGTRGGCF